MTTFFVRVIVIIAGVLLGLNTFADGPADKVTGNYQHAAPVNNPGDNIFTKLVSAHEALGGRSQHGFIYNVRPDGNSWDYIDLGDTQTACVNIHEDGMARIGGLVIYGTGPGVGRFFGWALEDKGSPGRMSDLTTGLRFDSAEKLLAWCESGDRGWANAIWPHIVVAGNFKVHNHQLDAD